MPFGQAQNQAYGYLFPHGAFFLARATSLGVPGWVTQRLWWALLLVVGFWGLVRVAEALGIGSPTSRVDRRGGVRAVAAGAHHPRRDLVGDAADDAGAVGAVAGHPGDARSRTGGDTSGAGSGRVLAARSALAIALMGAVNAVATLTGCLPALIWLVCHRPNRQWWRFTGVVGGVHRARRVVVGRRTGDARPGQSAVPRLHRVLRRYHAMDVADRDAAWHRRLDTVRRAQRHRGRLAGDGLGRGTGDHAGGRGAGSPDWPCGRCPRVAGSSRSCRSASSLLAAGYSGGLGSPVAHRSAGVPGRSGHAAAQHAQARTAAAAAAGTGPGASAGPNPVARQRTPRSVASGVRPSRTRQAGRGRGRRAGRARRGDIAGVDRAGSPRPARSTRSRSTGTTPPTGSTRTTPAVACWWYPARRSPPRSWGTSHDEPLQVLGDSPWGVRDSIPLNPPETIRALDSVQRLFAAGRPSAGLADTLARQGISYVVVRNDLDPETSRSARPILVHRAIDGSPGPVRRWRSSATRSARARWPGSSPTAGCGRDTPPSRSTASTPATPRPGHRGRTWSTPTRWPASTVDPRRCCGSTSGAGCSGQPPLGPMLLTADAQRAGLPAPVGHRHRYPDGARDRLRPGRRPLVGDPRARRCRGTPSTGCSTIPRRGAELVYGQWNGGRVSVSSSAADSTALPNVAPASGPAAAIDGDSVHQLGVQRAAVRGRPMAAGRLRPPGHQRHADHHPQRDRRRRPGPPHRGVDRQRHQHVAVRRGRASR